MQLPPVQRHPEIFRPLHKLRGTAQEKNQLCAFLNDVILKAYNENTSEENISTPVIKTLELHAAKATNPCLEAAELRNFLETSVPEIERFLPQDVIKRRQDEFFEALKSVLQRRYSDEPHILDILQEAVRRAFGERGLHALRPWKRNIGKAEAYVLLQYILRSAAEEAEIMQLEAASSLDVAESHRGAIVHKLHRVLVDAGLLCERLLSREVAIEEDGDAAGIYEILDLFDNPEHDLDFFLQVLIDIFGGTQDNTDSYMLECHTMGGRSVTVVERAYALLQEVRAIIIAKLARQEQGLDDEPTHWRLFHGSEEVTDYNVTLRQSRLVAGGQVNQLSIVRDWMHTVATNGMMLAQAPMAYKDCPDVVLAAVNENGLALQHASMRCRSLTNIVEAAMSNNHRACAHSLEEQRMSLESFRLSARMAGQAWAYAREYWAERVARNGLDLAQAPRWVLMHDWALPILKIAVQENHLALEHIPHMDGEDDLYDYRGAIWEALPAEQQRELEARAEQQS
mmetsp:Transcript_32823/g.60052  ORF Transcript_32823/g.60052 Transcript_32823/m.60052 type:complete len:512 (-) Transcript_32823:52-1587(-)